MQEFQGQQLMDLGGIVFPLIQVASHHVFYTFPLKIRPGEGSRVEQHLPNVFGKRVPVPDPEMVELVPAKKQAFEMEWRHDMVRAGDPLRHSIVVGIFSLEREVEQQLRNGASAEAAVRAESPQRGISIRN